MKISVHDLAHSKGVPPAATEAMLLMQDRIEAQAAEIERLREALKLFRGFGCPVCNGDCGAANPPVMCCPVQEADAALAKETAETFTRSDNV